MIDKYKAREKVREEVNAEYDCDDVDAFCKQIEENGGRVTRIPGRDNAWVHPTSSNFIFMEILYVLQ